MTKMIRKALFLSVPLLFLSNALHSGQSNDVLANQCSELSSIVAALADHQHKSECFHKLNDASLSLDKAGLLILDDHHHRAKKKLDEAVYNLQYAELNSCNHYIEISHSKFEAKKIKDEL